MTIEDHKFISTVLDKKDFVKFLEEIKIYDDLPISDMNRLRKKEDKKQKIIDYAESFYSENK